MSGWQQEESQILLAIQALQDPEQIPDGVRILESQTMRIFFILGNLPPKKPS